MISCPGSTCVRGLVSEDISVGFEYHSHETSHIMCIKGDRGQKESDGDMCIIVAEAKENGMGTFAMCI